MNQALLLKAGARGLVCWILLSAAGLLWGPAIMQPFVPLIEIVTDSVSDEYAARVDIVESEGESKLRLTATMVRRVPLNQEKGLSIPIGHQHPAYVHVVHQLVPPVILISLLAAWPTATLRRRIVLMVSAIPAAFLVIALTTPFQLAGLLEIEFQEATAKLGGQRDVPMILRWMVFGEGGGRWLLPLIVGLVCIRLTAFLDPRAR